jgi:hypothetical protein
LPADRAGLIPSSRLQSPAVHVSGSQTQRGGAGSRGGTVDGHLLSRRAHEPSRPDPLAALEAGTAHLSVREQTEQLQQMHATRLTVRRGLSDMSSLDPTGLAQAQARARTFAYHTRTLTRTPGSFSAEAAANAELARGGHAVPLPPIQILPADAGLAIPHRIPRHKTSLQAQASSGRMPRARVEQGPPPVEVDPGV